MIRRAARIEAELERLDALMSLGEAVDLPAYSTCASHLRRLFETLGLKRVPRVVTSMTTLDSVEVFSPLRHRHVEGASAK